MFKFRFLLFILMIFCLHFTLAQTEIAVLLQPWPPENWPENAKGEVAMNVYSRTDGKSFTVNQFPISDMGDVTYVFPDTLPSGGEIGYEPSTPSQMKICDDISPVISPANVGVAELRLEVYADGEKWGLVSIQSQDMTGLLEFQLVNTVILYAKDAVSITSSGTCSGEDMTMNVKTDIQLKAGLNFVSIQATANALGADAIMSVVPTPLGNHTVLKYRQ